MENIILQGDCLEIMQKMTPQSINLIVTSPPYMKGKDYELNTRMTDYENLIDNFLKYAHQLMTNTGLLFVNINGHRKLPSLPFWLHQKAIENKWNFVQEIIWYRKNAQPYSSNQRLVDLKEYILIFSATKDYTLHTDRVKVPTSDKDNRYGGMKPLTNVWEINCLTNNQFLKLPTNGASFPIQIPHNCILLGSNEGDIILDPFSGSGTTCASAQILNRKYIGIEINKNYCDMANKRINETSNQIDMFSPSRTADKTCEMWEFNKYYLQS